MFYSLFLTVIFFAVLCFFGCQLVRYFLKENRMESLLAVGGISGLGLYLILINALGHFLPIETVFYLVWALFLILGLGLFYLNKSRFLEWGINRKWQKILLTTALLLAVTSGIISFRFPFDPQGNSAPTAATIAEGNFPPLEIWAPQNPLSYHYAPELFSAAVSKVTGLPAYLAYDFQVAMMAGILFLLVFVLIKQFCRDNFRAFISSWLALYAGTFAFLGGIKGIPILYKLYVLHQEIPAPFKFVSDAFTSQFSFPALENMLRISWDAWALPLIIAVTYLYFYLIGKKTN